MNHMYQLELCDIRTRNIHVLPMIIMIDTE